MPSPRLRPFAITVPTNQMGDPEDSRRGKLGARKSSEQEWGIARFARGNILCKKIAPEKVVLIEPGGGWMFLDEYTNVQWVPKPGLDEIASLVLGFPASHLMEIQSFCSEPRTTMQIEENFTSLDLDVYHLRQLGVLREAGKIGRSKTYVWAGWSSEKLDRAIELMASCATRSINNPG